MQLRLTDADRERYGGPEWLDWDPNSLSYSEAVLMQSRFGINVATYVGTWLGGGSAEATAWALWLSLRRAGVEVDWDAFDPDVLGARRRTGEPEGKGPGAGPEFTPPTASALD